MQHTSLFASVSLLVFMQCGCGGHQPPAQQLSQPQDAPQETVRSGVHNAANSLDWSGTYEGVVPCADCNGIRTVVTLNKDLTYAFSATYLGKPGRPFEKAGTFAWNPVGNTVILAGLDNRPNKYFVGEDYLLQLDVDGRKIEGEMAGKYTLMRQDLTIKADSATVPLVVTTWYLKVIGGKEVATGPNTKRSFIVLRSEKNRVNGFGGCNTFAGTYLTKGPDRLSFSAIAATQRACPDMEMETLLFEVLAKTDSFAIRGDRLMLHKARMAPLAVFEAGPAE